MIELRNVVKAYGGRRVVDGVSLAVPRGSTFGFLGQNGAGKTTTMKMLVGLAAPDEGEIVIGGVSAGDFHVRQKIGFMPEAPYFYERLSGIEFMRLSSRLFGAAAARSDEELSEILRMTGIAEARHRAIGTYSKGMKQRLAFAQALVNDPEYLFLDEPLDGLDPLGRRELKRVMQALHAQGKTIFLNSHILFDVEEVCDAVGIIHEGKLLYTGPTALFAEGRTLEAAFVARIEEAHATVL